MMEVSDRYMLLVEKYLEGSLSSVERGELIGFVKDEPACGQYFVEALAMESVCRQVCPAVSSAKQNVESRERPVSAGRRRAVSRSDSGRRSPRQAKRSYWGRWASLAACLAIIVGAHMMNLRQADRMPDVMMAKLSKMSGIVHVERNGNQIVVSVGMELFAKDVVRTSRRGGARVEYRDEATSVYLLGDTRAMFWAENGAKRVDVPGGTIECAVARQPEGREMEIKTPHAVALIKGTRLRLMVDEESSRLEVYEGLVALTNILDGKSVEVAAGHMASAGAGMPFAVKAIERALTRRMGESAGPGPSDYVVGPIVFEDNFDKGLDNWEVLVGNDPAKLSLVREKLPREKVHPVYGMRSLKEREGVYTSPYVDDWILTYVGIATDRLENVSVASLRMKTPVTEDAFEVEIFVRQTGTCFVTPFPWAQTVSRQEGDLEGKPMPVHTHARWQCVPAGTAEDGTRLLEVRAFVGSWRDGHSFGFEGRWYDTSVISCEDRRIGFATGALMHVERIVIRRMIKK